LPNNFKLRVYGTISVVVLVRVQLLEILTVIAAVGKVEQKWFFTLRNNDDPEAKWRLNVASTIKIPRP
jgi:hypothetical protein